jgi:hypothetical protein
MLDIKMCSKGTYVTGLGPRETLLGGGKTLRGEA